MKLNSISLETRYFAPSSWWEHVPVGHWLVANTSPGLLVELGSHYGVSFFSFCEAAERFSQETHVFAVDTWEGDSQAGFYANNVFERVLGHQKKYHGNTSTLIRNTFTEASKYFGEGTIDLIHIDGLHTYEAVRKDYNEWKDKLKKGGTILFHDTNVREGGFGVWKLWEEIKHDGKFKCIELMNGHGLGIATLSETTPKWHDELIEVLPLLKAKGKLLSEIQERNEKIELIKLELQTQKKHSKNLEEIKAEYEERIENLLKRDTLRPYIAAKKIIGKAIKLMCKAKEW